LESRVVRDALPADVAAALTDLRAGWERDAGKLAAAVAKVDPTLERTVQTARNAALSSTQEIEKKVVASLKRAGETVIGQIARARAAIYPNGEPQERVLTLASFSIRYGPPLLDALSDEVARWAEAP
jgi:uncharacterized protein YllA (UPF0747 family)